MANVRDFAELLKMAAIGERVVALVKGEPGARRGRPKKTVLVAGDGMATPEVTGNGTDAPKRKRGRPRKIQPVPVESPADEPVDGDEEVI